MFFYRFDRFRISIGNFTKYHCRFETVKDLEDWPASFGLLNHPNVRTRLLELNVSLPSSSSSIHISTNTNYDHVCQNCLKLFSRERDLKRHLLAHTEQSQHVCRVCDRRYARKDALKRHQGSCKVENILYLFIIFFLFLQFISIQN